MKSSIMNARFFGVLYLLYHYFSLWKCLFELEFYGPFNTVKVMLSQSVNLLTLFLHRLSPLSG